MSGNMSEVVSAFKITPCLFSLSPLGKLIFPHFSKTFLTQDLRFLLFCFFGGCRLFVCLLVCFGVVVFHPSCCCLFGCYSFLFVVLSLIFFLNLSSSSSSSSSSSPSSSSSSSFKFLYNFFKFSF